MKDDDRTRSISARIQHMERLRTVTNDLFIIAETTVGRGEVENQRPQKRPYTPYSWWWSSR